MMEKFTTWRIKPPALISN